MPRYCKGVEIREKIDMKEPSIRLKAVSVVQSYLLNIIFHFVIFCLTMVALVLMLTVSWWVVSFCENILKVDLLSVKVLVGASDLLIIGHFVIYLWQGPEL